MLVQLWPYINDMVVKILKEQVEPEIQKNVPGFLSSIHFKEISLGEVVSESEHFAQRRIGLFYEFYCFTCTVLGNLIVARSWCNQKVIVLYAITPAS